MTYIYFILNILVALGLGGIIGLERQLTGRTIGIRTCVLVCMGACIFTSFPFCIDGEDILRMAAPIVSGVGFLGSGIIFKEGANVRGINTAATIWCTAAIGILAGAGLYGQASIAALCLVAGNLALRPLARRIGGHGAFNDMGYVYKIFCTCSIDREQEIRQKILNLLQAEKLQILNLSGIMESDDRIRLEVKFFYESRNYAQDNEKVVGMLLQCNTVHGVGWEILE